MSLRSARPSFPCLNSSSVGEEPRETRILSAFSASISPRQQYKERSKNSEEKHRFSKEIKFKQLPHGARGGIPFLPPRQKAGRLAAKQLPTPAKPRPKPKPRPKRHCQKSIHSNKRRPKKPKTRKKGNSKFVLHNPFHHLLPSPPLLHPLQQSPLHQLRHHPPSLQRDISRRETPLHSQHQHPRVRDREDSTVI